MPQAPNGNHTGYDMHREGSTSVTQTLFTRKEVGAWRSKPAEAAAGQDQPAASNISSLC